MAPPRPARSGSRSAEAFREGRPKNGAFALAPSETRKAVVDHIARARLPLHQTR